MNLLLANNATVSSSTNANTDYSTTMLTASSPLNMNNSVAVTQLSMLTKGGSNSSNSNINAGATSSRSIINNSEVLAT